MNKTIVDTNALLRFFLNDIPDQNKLVVALLQEAKEGNVQVYVPQIVVFELAFVLESYYEVNKIKAINILKALIATEYIEIDSRNVFLRALTLYRQNNCSLVDCFLIAQAEIDGAELFTFDIKAKRLLSSLQ